MEKFTEPILSLKLAAGTLAYIEETEAAREGNTSLVQAIGGAIRLIYQSLEQIEMTESL